MNTKTKSKVLFLCSHNSIRSQMAEAFLRHFGRDRYEVYSAGIEKSRINPLTIKVMEELNYNLSEQYSKEISSYENQVDFDILITVCSEADKKCPTIPGLKTKLHWSFEDPGKFQGSEEEKLEKFQEVRDQILKKIQEWLKE